MSKTMQDGPSKAIPTPTLYSAPNVTVTERADGTLLMKSSEELADYPRSVAAMLRHWAAVDPAHPLIAARDSAGGWVSRSYGEMAAAAAVIGQGLLDRELSSDRPLMIISGNSIDHLVISLAALTVGVPVAPISVAYSLQSKGHARIRQIAELLSPGAVFAEDGHSFAAALAALPGVPAIVCRGESSGQDLLASLYAGSEGPDVQCAFDAIDGDTVAKVLFTSGSTGTPKGVITTHRMLCANQQMMRQAWPFLMQERPVLVDWLPWSHTFGGNHNMNMVLANGGTLYIDEGRPVPGLFAKTVANLGDIRPTLSFNVPAGYAQLVPALEQDPEFAERFFSRLRLVFNAAAALPAGLRRRLETLGKAVTGREIPLTGSWGTTETAPAATSAHFDYDDARCIGVPLAGVELKLVPSPDNCYEIRVRGPLVTPGYIGGTDASQSAFDAEGFYCPGDAVSLAEPVDPNAGLLFRGRLAEDFKLSTGTFVHVGALRTALLSAASVLADAVIAGESRDTVCALAWLNAMEVGNKFGEQPNATGQVIEMAALGDHLARILGELNAGAGSSARIERLLIMAQPASLDAGEVTDKGYVNQRCVLANREELVELLYTEPAPPEVILTSQQDIR